MAVRVRSLPTNLIERSGLRCRCANMTGRPNLESRKGDVNVYVWVLRAAGLQPTRSKPSVQSRDDPEGHIRSADYLLRCWA